MNKAEIIKTISVAAGLTQVAAERAVSGFIEVVKENLQEGDPVVLTGFGTFSVHSRAPRAGRNPQTGESLEIPARNVVKFKAGSKLLDSVNG